MFINRKAELDQLSYLYHSNRAELFILYDHRQVGKIELLRAFDGESYTGFNGTTDAHGQVTFTLPQGSYRFRADYDGVSFWSGSGNGRSSPTEVAPAEAAGGRASLDNYA